MYKFINHSSVTLLLFVVLFVATTYSAPCTIGAVCYSTKQCNSTALYCAGPCDGPGRCVSRPASCPAVVKDQEDWNCGCDNKAYGSECLARKAGVEISYSGKCAVFGGITINANCTDNSECSINEYCYFPTGCGQTVFGNCKERPTACADLYSSACGCDGKTYSNLCHASSLGINIEKLGSCDASSQDIDLTLFDVVGNISGSLNTLNQYDQSGNIVDPYRSVYFNISKDYKQTFVSFYFNVPTPLLATLTDASGTVVKFIRLEMNWISRVGSEVFWNWRIKKANYTNQWSNLGNNNFVPNGQWAIMNNLISQNPLQYIDMKTGTVVIQFTFNPTKSACVKENRSCLFPALDYIRLFINYGVNLTD